MLQFDQRTMPSLKWSTDPTVLIQAFEARHHAPIAGALFAWAASTVESLHYLDDIDLSYDASHVSTGGHRPDVVDVAHARWATTSCITAIDLCAAGLGRAFCAHQSKRELDLADFAPNNRSKGVARVQHRGQLPLAALSWVDAARADPQYKTIKDARNWLTHSRLKRHFTLMAGGPPQRLRLELATKVPVRQIVEDARDCATRHVSGFLEIVSKL